MTLRRENRIGDHICYYSDLRKMKTHYPDWGITKSSASRPLAEIVDLLGVASWRSRARAMKILITGVCGFVGSHMAR